MTDVLRRLAELMDQLDDDDFEFHVDSDVTARPIRKGVSRRPSADRWVSSPHRKTGREKFEAKRKVKKLNWLLKKAEREGYAFEDLIEATDPPVRVVDKGDTAQVIVDQPGATLDWDEEQSVVGVELDGGRVITKEVPFTVGGVKREERGSMTIFDLSEGSEGNDADQ